MKKVSTRRVVRWSYLGSPVRNWRDFLRLQLSMKEKALDWILSWIHREGLGHNPKYENNRTDSRKGQIWD